MSTRTQDQAPSAFATTSTLPQLVRGPYLADGGLETSIIFQQGIDLVDFAAFTLLDGEEGREALRRYYDPYLRVAAEKGTGIVVDTPTWRASMDWVLGRATTPMRWPT